MTSEQPTRKMVKLLKANGFEAIRTTGSHTVYQNGTVKVTIPDGHKTISPGVVRQIEKAIKEANS